MTPCPAPLLSQRCARLRASETTVAPPSHPPRTQQLWRNRPARVNVVAGDCREAAKINHSEQLKPELYREAAEGLRELARECPLSDIQGDWRDLARALSGSQCIMRPNARCVRPATKPQVRQRKRFIPRVQQTGRPWNTSFGSHFEQSKDVAGAARGQ